MNEVLPGVDAELLHEREIAALLLGEASHVTELWHQLNRRPLLAV